MSTTPGWVGPTIAIALVIIALGFVAFVMTVLLVGKRAAEEATALGREVAELRRDLAPTIHAANKLAESGAELGAKVADLGDKVKEEVTAVLATSRKLRRATIRGARRVEGRLEELDALYEVVSAEVEDTALDVAAKLRAFRGGVSAVGRIKRFLGWRR